MKKKALISLFIIVFLLGFSKNYFEEYISNFSYLKNFNIDIDVEFNIQKAKNIEASLTVINNRFFIFIIKKPELFSGIVYLYDLYTDSLYTKVRKSFDVSEDVKVFTNDLPNIVNILTSIFKPNKFTKKTINYKNYSVSTYEPKDKLSLKLFLGIDYTKFKIYFKKMVNDIYIFDKFEILNSTEKQKVIVKIKKLNQLNTLQATTILKNYLP